MKRHQSNRRSLISFVSFCVSSSLTLFKVVSISLCLPMKERPLVLHRSTATLFYYTQSTLEPSSRDQSYRQPHCCVSMVVSTCICLTPAAILLAPFPFRPDVCNLSPQICCDCCRDRGETALLQHLQPRVQRCRARRSQNPRAPFGEVVDRRMGSDEKMKNTTRSMPGLASTVEITRLLKPCSKGPIGTARSWTFY
jgi:hypothetical protein